MKTPEYKRFEEMIAETRNVDDRACSLVLAANLDNRLSELVKAYSIEIGKEFSKEVFEGTGFLSTFSSKINLCYMMGLIPENLYHDLTLIRKIRNYFAHEEHGWDFNHEKIRSRCLSLKMPRDMVEKEPTLKDHCESPREVFVICAASATLILLNLCKEAMLEKRKSPPPARII